MQPGRHDPREVHRSPGQVQGDGRVIQEGRRQARRVQQEPQGLLLAGGHGRRRATHRRGIRR